MLGEKKVKNNKKYVVKTEEDELGSDIVGVINQHEERGQNEDLGKVLNPIGKGYKG
ncbi:MAG TPA: hypothetical protein VGK06_04245 [Methanosarcina sp.]|jgi:hypothetical protein